MRILKFFVLVFFSSFLCANELNKGLTPLGANPAASNDGLIPAWKGAIPANINFKSGDTYPDPYQDEAPVVKIDAKNYQTYQDKLTVGQIQLFKKHPATFSMLIYPSHRAYRYHPEFEARTAWNHGKSRLVGSIDGLQQYTGGIPFPVPNNGAEVIWNARLSQPTPVADALYDEVAVFSKGNQQRHRSKLLIESPMAYEYHPIGKTADQIGDIAAFVFYEVLAPKRKKGEMVIVHEPIDQYKHDRKAWVYIPGAKRVKRAPNAGYDTPIGPGGLMTADDSMGFNGAMDRYDWQLVGKKPMYIPYHNYQFDRSDIGYETLLTKGHANPQYIRYELHRVWIVEATLKGNNTHVYAKRRFYIDEDTWQIVAADMYDGRNELWRTSFNLSVYDFFLKGYITRAQLVYDFNASAYVAMRLVNETRPTQYAMETKGADFYTPANLRKMGRR